MPTTKKKTKKVKKKTAKKIPVNKATAKHGNTKYNNPVDKSIRMEAHQWDELESFCPPGVVRFMSWNDKMQILLELARKGYGT